MQKAARCGHRALRGARRFAFGRKHRRGRRGDCKIARKIPAQKFCGFVVGALIERPRFCGAVSSERVGSDAYIATRAARHERQKT